MMRKLVICIALVAIALLSFGCMGKKGLNGNVFLRVQLVNCTRYWDNNDGIPFGFSSTVYYQCGPGTYSYEYDTADGWQWEGTYTLVAEEGEPGTLFQNGDDGQDRKYTLTCQSSGPTLTYFLGKDTSGKLIRPTQTGENEFELIHSDGVYRFHIKAFRKPADESRSRSKIR